MKIPISNRLLRCASLVPAGARVADVGCDHGYLGIYLLREGVASRVTASDLRRQPLERARQNAARFGVTDKMRFVLCAGLDGVRPDEAEAVVCAGMGGETIAGALAAAPWLCGSEVNLVLQPATSAAALRRFLAENGFALQQELPVVDGRYCYSVLRAVWTGERVSPGPLFCELGLLRGQRSPAAAACFAKLLRRLEAELRGRRAAGESGLGALEDLCAAVREELSSCKP